MKKIPILITLACLWASLSDCTHGYDLGDPAEPWSDAKAGEVTDVPVPFEPLDTDGTRVSMWGRTYNLGSVLPTQINNQRVSIFHQAPRVVIDVLP